MALTPKMALGNKPDELKARVVKLEKQLDMKLMAEYNGRNSVDIHLTYNEDTWVMDQLKKKYETAGWCVTTRQYGGDQRDPGYTVFSVSAKTDYLD